jgi:hypothetical protein
MRLGAVFFLAVAVASCGGETETADNLDSGAVEVEPGAAAGVDATDGADPADANADASAGVDGSGWVTVDGVRYEFVDVTLCEVGGETWGEDWRDFIAFTEDGHTHTRITHGPPDAEFLTGFDLSVGLANARTLDEGNPDESYSTGLGGSVNAELGPNGASGTAEVTRLGAGDFTVEWSFTC